MPDYTNTNNCRPNPCDAFTLTTEQLQRGDFVVTCPDGNLKVYAPVEVNTNDDGSIVVIDAGGNQTPLPNPVNIVITETNESGETTLTTFGSTASGGSGGSGTGGGAAGGGGINIPGLESPSDVRFEVSQDARFVTFFVDDNSVTVPTSAGVSALIVAAINALGGTNATIINNMDGTSTVTIGNLSFDILNNIGPKTPISMMPNALTNEIDVILADGTAFSFAATVSMGLNAPALNGTFPILTTGVAMTPFTFGNSGGPIDTWAISGTLPAGINFNAANGQFTGTTNANGSAVIMVTATNAAGADTINVPITINVGLLPPDLSTSGMMIDGINGVPITAYNPVNTGGLADTWTSTNLPAGLSLNATTGEITGTPTVAGNFAVAITAINAAGSDTTNVAINLVNSNIVLPAALSLTNARTDGTAAQARLQLPSNGETFTNAINTSGSQTGPDWFSPNTVGIGLTHEVMFEQVSGDPAAVNQGAFGVFQVIDNLPLAEGVTLDAVPGQSLSSVVRVTIREIANPINSKEMLLTLNASATVVVGALAPGVTNLATFLSFQVVTGVAGFTFNPNGVVNESGNIGVAGFDWYTPSPDVGIGADYTIEVLSSFGLDANAPAVGSTTSLSGLVQFLVTSNSIAQGQAVVRIREVANAANFVDHTLNISVEVGGQ